MSERRRRWLQQNGLARGDELSSRGEALAEDLYAERDREGLSSTNPDPPQPNRIPDRFWAPEPINDCGTIDA